MPRQAGVTVENNFSRGLITEVTGLNSPENSVVESQNVVYDQRGRATRRPGLEFEHLHQNWDVSIYTNRDGAVSSFVWDAVSDGGSTTFVVVQLADYLTFWQSMPGQSLSSQREDFFTHLEWFKVPGWDSSLLAEFSCSYAMGNGYLFVTHPLCEPFYLKYDSTLNTVTSHGIRVEARDFEGVPDGLLTWERPTVLTLAHQYNLWNQGWSQTVRIHNDAGAATAIHAWRNDGLESRPDYPSNSDIWWVYKGVSPDGEQQNIFRIPMIDKVAMGNSHAPRGHYIYSAWATARNGALGLPVVYPDVPETHTSGHRPSCVAFWAGRVFYAGVNKDGFNGNVYFSQILESIDQVGRCYQVNDPTSEVNFDLLPTDGGVIRIQDIATIVDMRVIGPALYVFATNGVWSVQGSNDGGFKANEYMVKQVSTFPALSKTSVVDVGGLPVWWNNDGIFAIKPDQTGLSVQIEKLSLTSIQSFFDDIPVHNKRFAIGAYNDLEGKVYWLYKQKSEWDSLADQWTYDRVLVYDTLTGAFYPHTLPDSTAKIRGVFSGQDFDGKQAFKFITTGNYIPGMPDRQMVSFTEFRHIQHSDFIDSIGPIPFESFFITGHRIRGNVMSKFQSMYVVVLFETDHNSSCMLQGVWDYASGPENGRMTNPQQVYITRTPYAHYQRSRRLMRGNGKSLQFKFYSEGDKPFTLIGWATFDTAETIP